MRIESYKYRGLFTALLGVLLLLSPSGQFEPAGYVGIPFFLAASLLRLWTRMHIGEHSRGSALVCPGIVKTGPYRYVKHPLYISNFMAGTAFVFFHAGFSYIALGFCAVYGAFLSFLAHRENVFLASCPTPHILCSKQSIIKSIINDRYTWLWQIAMLILIFYIPHIKPTGF